GFACHQPRPVAPLVQPVRALLAHAAGDDDFWIGGEHRFHADARCELTKSGEYVFSTAQTDGIGDQVFAVDGHQRLVPDLVEHAHRWALAVARRKRVAARAEI